MAGWHVSTAAEAMAAAQFARLGCDVSVKNPDGPTNYIAAADIWLARHKSRTAMCFVNFRDVPLDGMPRIYLAWPREVADKLKGARGGDRRYDPL